MSHTRSSKEFDIKKCLVSQKKGEPASKCHSSKEVCTLKLKDAEKTIANKDIIIKMLQDQVKKLEETYKQNLRATENFRYKFHVASEQIKRLRSTKKIDDKDSNSGEARVKEPKRKSSKEPPETPPERCCTAQQIQNIENFIKSHYELLQSLVQKFSEKQNLESDSEANKYCMEQLGLLQKEIVQLKEENLKLNDQLELQKDPLIPKVNDSILETYRRTNEELQKKVSQMIELGSGVKLLDDDESDEDDMIGKRISFSRKPAHPSDSNKNTLKVIKEEDKSLQNEEFEPQSRDSTSASENVSCLERHVSVATADVNVIEISEDGSQEGDTENVPEVTEQPTNDKACQCSMANERQPNVPEETKPEVVDSPKEKKEHINDKACQCTIDKEKQPSTTEMKEPESVKKEVSEVIVEVPADPYQNAICFCSGVSCTTVRTESCEDIVPPVNEVLEAEGQKITFTDEVQPPDVKETSVATTQDLNDITEKLNDIRNKVTELLQKQTDSQNEIELLKKELAVSRDTTKECTENIAKLKETIDEQKQTFLTNFQEHKKIIDNLTQVNDKIQSELGDLKAKIDTLFKSLDEVRNEHAQDRKTCGSDDVITINELHKSMETHKEESHTIKSVGLPTAYMDQLETESDVPASTDAQKDIDKPQEQLEVLEDNKITFEKMKCIKDLITYYKKVSTEVLTLSTPHSDEQHPDNCVCRDIDIYKYIDKVKSENSKLKSTISSIINHLNEKMIEMKDGQNQKQENDNLCECEETPKNLEIEDIYNAVRTTCAAKKPALHESSTSCVCQNKPLVSSSHTCSCISDLPASQNKNIEDVYASVLCMCKCGVYPSQTMETCGPSAPVSGNEENSAVPVCPNLEGTPSEDCLVSNVENYVNYLYEQLNIISCIENRIEDMRCHIKTP